jgi:hypothetical protein
MYSQITKGKYQHIEVDNDFDFYIYDEGQKFPIDRFSGGEVDLANLVLRIAISKTLGELSGAGNIGFLYCITYGLGRFAIEFLRNDYRGEVGIFSTSQFISLFIVLLGVVAMAVNHKLKNCGESGIEEAINK